jgi:hypothetical protein
MVTAIPDRRGFVLIIVLLLMAVGGALMLDAIDGSLAERGMVQSGTAQRRALVGAETTAWTALEQSIVPALRGAPLGRFSSVTRVVGDMTLTATLDRVDTSVVWIVAVATVRRSNVVVARHRVGISALIPRDTLDMVLHPVPERAWAELF